MVHYGSEGGKLPKDGLIFNAPSLNPAALKPKHLVSMRQNPRKYQSQKNQSTINIWEDGPSYGSPTGALYWQRYGTCTITGGVGRE